MKTRGDFDDWNVFMQEIEFSEFIPYFQEGEIWWVYLGVNIGHEMGGKGQDFSRPVLILKKYNKSSFLCIPLSTSLKPGKYRINIGNISGKEATVNLSQMRNTDARRLKNKITVLDMATLQMIKRKASQMNFG
jgi:mRNA-degrading endonuclease toxin of MazEF toxin-antitoxin module